MTQKANAQLVQQFFSNDEFRAYADAISQGVLIINSDKLIVFANKVIQEFCFEAYGELTPYCPYRNVIDAQNTDILNLIENTFELKKNISRQISKEQRIYWAESKVITHNNQFKGCAISIVDITSLVLREKQHELIYQISSALGEVHDLDYILKISIDQIRRFMSYASINIMLLDPSTRKLNIHFDTNAKTKFNHAARSFALGEGIAGRAALENRTFSIYNVQESEEYAQRKEDDSGSLLVIPIATRNNTHGVVNVTTDKPHYYTENEVQFLTIVANEIAIAIDNSLLYGRLTRKIKQLSKLFWISSFSGTQVLDKRIDSIINTVPDLIDTEGCCLYFYDTSTHSFILKNQSGGRHKLPDKMIFERGGVLKEVIETTKTQLINDPANYHYGETLQRFNIYNVVVSPLIINKHAVGAIAVYNKATGNFDDEDRHLLEITAHRISTKIENSDLIKRVQSERDLLDKIIENTSEGVAVLNADKTIIIWNRYLEELTGINSQDAVGKPAYEILHHKLGMHQLMHRLYPQPGDETVTTDILDEEMRVGNDRIWVSSICSLTKDNQGNTDNTIVVIRNISKERELLHAKNEFVSITTHELRTPLTATKGYLSMILNGDAGPLAPKQRTYFDRAYTATQRLSNLVEELLQVVRIEENRLKFTPTVFSVDALLEQIKEEFSQAAATKGITLTLHSSNNHTVFADAEKTRQIFANLIDNAIKYTPKKGSVTVNIKGRRTSVAISVQDTGVGIPAHYQSSIFDRFVRAPNRLSMTAGGAGLGLYIVKNLVERQNGTIHVESQVGSGTTFTVTLPKPDKTNQKLQERSSHAHTYNR